MTSPLELTANAFTLASILLARRASLHTWWTGIVGCVLLGVLFVERKLYADASLQLFFMVTCVIGWVAWRRSRGPGPELPVRRAGKRIVVGGVVLAALVTAGYAALLDAFTDAAAPVPDSAVMAFSVLAQLLLMGRCVESWPVWLVVNAISVPLYASRGLLLMAVLYVGYLVNAVVAWREWVARARRAP